MQGRKPLLRVIGAACLTTASFLIAVAFPPSSIPVSPRPTTPKLTLAATSPHPGEPELPARRKLLRKALCPPTLDYCKKEKIRIAAEAEARATAEAELQAKVKAESERKEQVEREWKELKWVPPPPGSAGASRSYLERRPRHVGHLLVGFALCGVAGDCPVRPRSRSEKRRWQRNGAGAKKRLLTPPLTPR